MRLWQRFALLAVGMLVGTGSLNAQTKTTLRFKFEKDEQLEYVLFQEMKLSTKVMDKDINVDIKQSMDMTWKVLKVEKGAGQIKMTFPHVKMDMDGPMGKIHVDSKKPKELDDPIGKSMAQVVNILAGLEVTFIMEPTGKIKDLQMPEKVKENLKNVATGEVMSDLFSDDSLKMMGTGGLLLPKDPVAEGGKPWTQDINMKMPMGRTKGKIDYTYKGEKDGDGKKLEEISLKPVFKIEAVPDAPFQMKLASQEAKGTAYFDNKTGKIYEVKMEQELEMTIEGSNNMRMTQTINQSTSMKLKKGE